MILSVCVMVIHTEHSAKKSESNRIVGELTWIRSGSMASAIYGVVVTLAVIALSLGGYIWYLTPGKRDRTE
jgi:hypothetical protein